MRDKKSIALLIIAIVIFCIAVVFSIWSFTIDKTITREKQNQINSSNTTNQEENKDTVIQNTEEESKTKDFEATYKAFSVQDKDGKMLDLLEYQNQPIVIFFWNESNKDSVEMLNKIDEQYESYKDKVVFIAISTEEYNGKQEIKVPIYEDKQKEVASLYNVTELPTIIYINKENEVFNAKTGISSTDALKANLDILSENF